jgi:hypothetical protein
VKTALRTFIPTLLLLVCITYAAHGQPASGPFDLHVFPPEHKAVTDPQTGIELLFLTTNPASDRNLYFHEQSWLADSSMILFTSGRENGGAMAYLVATGELLRLTTPNGGLGAITAAVSRNSVFGLRGNTVVEMSLASVISSDVSAAPSEVTAEERVICTLCDVVAKTALNESCDGRYLSLGVEHTGATPGPGIIIIDVKSGAVQALCRLDGAAEFASHVQWSRTNPNLLSFAGSPQRLWAVDIRNGVPRCVYIQQEDELATHESWWVEDQILFCGGTHPKPTEDSHVKVLDIHSGQVRIVGAGSWWAGAVPHEVAKENWWHAAGSANGRWVVADNWHGDISLFEGHTTRERELTLGHRTYGKGTHPHVGWDRRGEQVIFASHTLGDENVCVATIPRAWQESARTEGLAPAFSGADGPLSLAVGEGFPEPIGGQQGIATDGVHIYVQETSLLVKYDLKGKEVARSDKRRSHHGGICYLEGKIYAAVSKCVKETNHQHWVKVYDATTLKEIAEFDIGEHFDCCAGGIAYYKDHFYVAESYFDNDHRDLIVKFDNDFNLVERYRVDFKCSYGIQGLEYIPPLGMFMVNSHDRAFYLINTNFEDDSLVAGSAPFRLQDVAYFKDGRFVLNKRAAKKVLFAEVRSGNDG